MRLTILSLLRAEALGHVSDEGSLLQMPQVELQRTLQQDEASMLQGVARQEGQDASECHCPGYYEEECKAQAHQGCLWSKDTPDSANAPWCQCDPAFVPDMLATPPPLSSAASPVLRAAAVFGASSVSSEDSCIDILREGMYDEIRDSAMSHHEENLRQLDESYSYENYQQDHAEAQASGFDAQRFASSGSGGNAKVSGSYGLFSASVSGSYYKREASSSAVSTSMMTASEFSNAMERAVSAKTSLESSSADDTQVEHWARTVSPVVADMYNQCEEFRGHNLYFEETHSTQTLTMGIRYGLGASGLPLHAPQLLGVEVTPEGYADCSVIGRDSFPVTLNYGSDNVESVFCRRNIDGDVDVNVFTNKGNYHAQWKSPCTSSFAGTWSRTSDGNIYVIEAGSDGQFTTTYANGHTDQMEVDGSGNFRCVQDSCGGTARLNDDCSQLQWSDGATATWERVTNSCSSSSELSVAGTWSRVSDGNIYVIEAGSDGQFTTTYPNGHSDQMEMFGTSLRCVQNSCGGIATPTAACTQLQWSDGATATWNRISWS